MADMPIPVTAAVRMSLDIAICFFVGCAIIAPIRVKVNVILRLYIQTLTL